MPVSPLVLAGDEKLKPPQPKFAIAEGASDADQEANRASHHSRTTSGTVSWHESPPVTPRSISFGNTTNPFSASLIHQSFYTTDQTPGTSPTHLQNESNGGFPFPDVGSSTPRSGVTSVSTSVADLTRNSHSFYNRTAADYGSGSPRPMSARSREAFASPRTRPMTMYSTVQPSIAKIERDRPKSTMLASPDLSKPWLQKRDPYQRISYALTYAFIFLGFAAGAIRCYFGWKEVRLLTGNLCPVLIETFDTEDGVFGDNGKFFREVDMSGFGNGEFEMTTASENNSYVRNGMLYITPTLTSDIIGEDAIVDGHVFNITGCTFNITQGISYTSSIALPTNSSAIGADQAFDIGSYTRACSAVSNATSGQIINPIQSARISTRKTASIRYGRVEVRAKIPTGDWLWPAIWMLPVDNTYGPWPISGMFFLEVPPTSHIAPLFINETREIDIMEARGNGPNYPFQGTNWVRGSLNWGPLTWLNAVSKTFGAWPLRRGTYDQGFHDYVLEWDQDFMRISVDTRLHHLLDLRINEPFFKRGDFPAVVQNGSEAVILDNPWKNGSNAAPFDQPFYLILNVAVGGTNGWFPDGGGKPWLDGSNTAMGDFWANRKQWLPTWSTSNVEDRSLVIDHVKMWQQC
ncbi:Beta-1,3-glucan-binding protein [Psilocybe cubensis]|uniref:Beta-1,3-glucan-binding protein n=2 Tax=Psilocybe cubensis TaxID=181762 RepID=A0ACB8GIV9_PSICU|nr:Beta-1,3-glucan-binding protein [Psilocybe cubensis]KAH9475151.1 Beta-1,3-glucan-binding protein [Psilocybe cubensis]